MNLKDIETGMICEGDYVIDRLDGELRKVASFSNTTVNMTDGGCIGIDEIKSDDIRLESEVY